ncbi:hypothetical protein L1987_51230 [Smallanthus sonchifolius]|uniref:Uncharacterized protein n=1 Tax=Smallanthus sonchifolius TaxID=185202 RepID=A0ACB9EQ32_9ASTR|nr:hypothetical protein L1987_51230 [Smallanthus sonchifolius]
MLIVHLCRNLCAPLFVSTAGFSIMSYRLLDGYHGYYKAFQSTPFTFNLSHIPLPQSVRSRLSPSSNQAEPLRNILAILPSLIAPMARVLSRSARQLYGSQSVLQPQQHAAPIRLYAKEAAPKALKGDEMLKGIFLDVKKKFETAIGVLRKEPITIDPEDPAAVEQYAKVMKTVREKADLFSESQRIQFTIKQRTDGIQDARSYLLALKDIRLKRGFTDELGAEAMMMDALEKVEKEIKKPLMRNDKKGMALLTEEFNKINQKLGIRKEDLPKYEEDLEKKIAKAQLEELKKEALEAMETQKKREEFNDEEMPDVKSLDIRNML